MFLEKRNAYESNFKTILRDGMLKSEFIKISESTAFQIIINSVKWIHYYAKKMTKTELEEKRKDIKYFISEGFFKK